FFMPLAGWMVDAWGVHPVLFGSSLVLALGVAWFAAAKALTGLYWAVLGFGAGGAGLTMSGLRLMPEAFQVGYAPTPEGAFCVGFALVLVAALFTMHVYPRLIERLGFRNTVLVTALVCLAPATIVSFEDVSAFPAAQATFLPAQDLVNPRL